jgi:hypothetical protein
MQLFIALLAVVKHALEIYSVYQSDPAWTVVLRSLEDLVDALESFETEKQCPHRSVPMEK